MAKRFFINPYGVLFHPELDRNNSYKTIVCNWKTDKVLKINRFGYEILKIVNDNPGILCEDIYRLVVQKQGPIKRQKIDRFLSQMVQENTVFEK